MKLKLCTLIVLLIAAAGLFLLLLRLLINTKSNITLTNISAESAFILGFMPLRAIAYIKTERVVTPALHVKKLITKSSIESVTDSMNPVMMPGMISGRMTLKKV